MSRLFEKFETHVSLFFEEDGHEQSKLRCGLDEIKARQQVEADEKLEMQFLVSKLAKSFDRTAQCDREFSKQTTTTIEQFENVRREPIKSTEAARFKEILEMKKSAQHQFERDALTKEVQIAKHRVFSELYSFYRTQRTALINLRKSEQDGWIVDTPDIPKAGRPR